MSLDKNASENEIYAIDSKFLLRIPNYSRPLIIEKTKGLFLFSKSGQKFLDFSSGWNVSNLGWSNPVLTKTLLKSKAPTYIPPWFTNEYKINLAKTYSNYLNDDYKVLYGVSGSDAVEFALKVAIKRTKKNNFISFNNSFHGSTIELLKCGNFPNANSNFLLSSENYSRLELPDKNRLTNWSEYLQTIKNTIQNTDNLAGLILEPFFTNPGILFGDSTFYEIIQDELKKKGALLIVDEIGTGFGRTGKMFAFEHFNLTPDIIVLGKAITSGILPLSGTLIKRDIAEECKGIGFYSTYGGTPVACEIAMENFNLLLKNDFLSSILNLGQFALEYIKEHFKPMKSFYDVRGMGLSIGVELTDENNNPLSNSIMEQIKSECQESSLIINFSNYTSTFIIMPPLIITKEKLINGLEVLKNSITKVIENVEK